MVENKHLDSLIGRMQRYGDEEAFAEFYKLTAKGLYSYLMSVVGKKENAEDLMQDTYIRFRQNVQSYVRGTNPTAYLIQIGKNLALNFLKRSGYERQTDFSEWEPSDDGESVEKQADTTVTDAIAKVLNGDEAQIVKLHVVAGLKHREIAEITGKPLGTVLWTYNNSLNKLRKYLKEDENANR